MLRGNPSPTGLSIEANRILGAQSGFFYTYGNLLSNISILVAGVSYLALIIPPLNNSFNSGIFIIFCIWFFILLSYKGTRLILLIVGVSITFLLICVVITSIYGWKFFKISFFISNWNVTGHTNFHAIFMGFVLLLFAYVGVETVANNHEAIKNPKKNVSRATTIGFIIVAIIYISSTTVLNGMFPSKELANNLAPFSLALQTMFHSKAIGWIVSIIAAVSCIAGFLIWQLNSAYFAKASADNNFLPKIYSKLNKYAVPYRGLILNGIIMTIIEIIFMVLDSGLAQAFKTTVTISVLLLMFPYFYSGLGLWKIEKQQNGRVCFQTKVSVIIVSIFVLLIFFSCTAFQLYLILIVFLIVLGFYAIKLK